MPWKPFSVYGAPTALMSGSFSTLRDAISSDPVKAGIEIDFIDMLSIHLGSCLRFLVTKASNNTIAATKTIIISKVMLALLTEIGGMGVDIVAVPVDGPELTLFCRFICANMFRGDSTIPLLSTLQYSNVLLVPGVVICGCPYVATDFVGPLLIL